MSEENQVWHSGEWLRGRPTLAPGAGPGGEEGAAPQEWEQGPDPPWHAWAFYCPAFTLWPPVLPELHSQVLGVLSRLILWKKNGHTEQQDYSKQ